MPQALVCLGEDADESLDRERLQYYWRWDALRQYSSMSLGTSFAAPSKDAGCRTWPRSPQSPWESPQQPSVLLPPVGEWVRPCPSLGIWSITAETRAWVWSIGESTLRARRGWREMEGWKVGCRDCRREACAVESHLPICRDPVGLPCRGFLLPYKMKIKA